MREVNTDRLRLGLGKQSNTGSCQPSSHQIKCITRLARLCLPSPNYLLQYPLHIIYTKAAFSETLQRPSQPETNYLRVQGVDTSEACTQTQDSPGRKWLREAPKQLYKAKLAKGSTLDGADLWQVEPVLDVSKRLGYLAVASYIYKQRGVFGFLQGLGTAHLTDSIHAFATLKFKHALDCVYRRTVTPLSLQTLRQTDSFRRRFYSWFKTDEGRTVITKLLASTLSSAITYPLRVILLRQIVYEPYDNKPLCFTDITKLSIIYDGPKVFYSGLKTYLLVKVCTGAVAAFARAAVVAANWDDGDEKLGVYVAEQSKAMAESLCHPLIQHVQWKQACSYIPGLIAKGDKSVQHFYRMGAPGMFLMLACNAVLLGIRITASTHFHFLLPETEED